MTEKPILIHAHVYYPRLWPELKRCIQNIAPHPFELFVTFVAEHPDIEADIRESFPAARILHVPNRGYDIGPFIDVLKRVNLADYSYIVKLHTKRDVPNSTACFRRLTGGRWRAALLSFIRMREVFESYLAAFEVRPKLGMVANYKLIVRNEIWNDKSLKRQLKSFWSKHRLPHLPYSYVGGNMFLARARVFERLQSLNLSLDDFVETNGHQTSFAHVLERLFGFFVSAQGLTVEDPIGDPTGRLGSGVKTPCRTFDFFALLRANFIDMGVFVHGRDVYLELGGFDENREVEGVEDWDLIIRYTHRHPPLYLPEKVLFYKDMPNPNRLTEVSDERKAKRDKYVYMKHEENMVFEKKQVFECAHVSQWSRESLSLWRQGGELEAPWMVAEPGEN